MGLKIFSDGPTYVTPSTNTSPNPNPYRFTIKHDYRAGVYYVLLVNYPDCTTFGGNKVMVYKGATALFNAQSPSGKLDPHFLENASSPIARFPGDDDGWNAAVEYAEWLSNK